MGLPSTLGAYEDCFALFDAAIADSRGIRAKFPDHGTANHFQMRMHQARKLKRHEACRIYPRDDHRWGQSEYDRFIVQVREDTLGGWWIYVQPHGAKILTVESLGELEGGWTEIPPTEAPLQLEDKSNEETP